MQRQELTSCAVWQCFGTQLRTQDVLTQPCLWEQLKIMLSLSVRKNGRRIATLTWMVVLTGGRHPALNSATDAAADLQE